MKRFCTSCGDTLEPDARFCSECGKPIDAEIKPIESSETMAMENQSSTGNRNQNPSSEVNVGQGGIENKSSNDGRASFNDADAGGSTINIAPTHAALLPYIANAMAFAGLYVILMLPTYILPYLGSNSAAMISIQQYAQSSGKGGTLFFTFVHIGCLVGLIAITWLRAKLVGKTWLVVLPILATVFDFVPGLSSIPMVPTVMHLLAIVLGVSSSPVSAETTESP